VAYWIACAQDVPDHTVIARFRQRHERALGDVFAEVLIVCARAGMGRLGTVALDGTKIAANASLQANRAESWLREGAGQILAEAAEADAAEDEQFGPDRRGDELPPQLADPDTRAGVIRAALASIEAERAAERDAARAAERVTRARDGYEATLQRVEQTWARHAEAAAAGRPVQGRPACPPAQHRGLMRTRERLERAEADLAGHLSPPEAGSPAEKKRNLTDVESRIMKTRTGFAQAYNGQLVVSEDYLIIAADLSNAPVDVTAYQPMITAAHRAARQIGAARGEQLTLGCVLADAGYASNANLTAEGPDRLIALGTRRDIAAAARTNPANGPAPVPVDAWRQMDHQLRTPDGAARYRRRGALVEPVNAHIKDGRGLRRFARRGLTAARSEFRFAAAVTNLLRLRALPA
jgi:Transposase DDE domain